MGAGRRQRAARDLCRFIGGQTEEPEHAFGVVDVGVLRGPPVEHGSHHGEERALGGVQSDLFAWHAEAPRPDAGTEVATSVGAEGGEQDVAGYVEPHEQPAQSGSSRARRTKLRWAQR